MHAVLDAGRGEFYYGEYVGRRCLREVLMVRAELMAAVAGGVVVVCEAKVAEALAELQSEWWGSHRRLMLCRLRWSGSRRGSSMMRLRWMRTICDEPMLRSLRSLRCRER